MGTIMKNGKTYSTSPSLASDIVYDNSGNNLPGTVQTAIDEVYNRPVNNNLLINSNFANPVNQRGEATKSDSGYWIDRWRKGSNISCSIGNGYVEITRNSQSSSSSFIQPIEVTPLLGKTVTFSVKLYNGSITSVTTTIPSTIPSQYGEIAQTSYIDEMFRLMMALDETGVLQVGVIPYTNKTIRLEWAKLELGDHATPYVPRLYEEEYELCLRYYQYCYCQVVINSISNNTVATVIGQYPKQLRIRPTFELVEANVTNTSNTGCTINSYKMGTNHYDFFGVHITFNESIKSGQYGFYVRYKADAEL